jgi:hypothetical protein
MQFAGLKSILRNHFQLQLDACWGGVIMAASWQLKVKMISKHIFETRK